MQQEDINQILAKHPSPEAEIGYQERIQEAISRGCACKDCPSGWDSDCFYQDHQKQSKMVCQTNEQVLDSLHTNTIS